MTQMTKSAGRQMLDERNSADNSWGLPVVSIGRA